MGEGSFVGRVYSDMFPIPISEESGSILKISESLTHSLRDLELDLSLKEDELAYDCFFL